MTTSQQLGLTGTRASNRALSGLSQGSTFGAGQRTGLTGIRTVGTPSFAAIPQQFALAGPPSIPSVDFDAEMKKIEEEFALKTGEQNKAFEVEMAKITAPAAPSRPEKFYIPTIGGISYDAIRNVPASSLQIGFKRGPGRAYMPDGSIINIGSYDDLASFFT